MDKEKIFSKFVHGDITEDTPYAKELRELHGEFNRRLKGGGCAACRRRNAVKVMKSKVIDLLSRHE